MSKGEKMLSNTGVGNQEEGIEKGGLYDRGTSDYIRAISRDILGDSFWDCSNMRGWRMYRV